MKNRLKTLYAILLTIALFAVSCDNSMLGNDDTLSSLTVAASTDKFGETNSRTVMPTEDTFISPNYFELELSSGSNTYAPSDYQGTATEDIVFTNIPIGEGYTLKAYGYNKISESKKVLIGYGETTGISILPTSASHKSNSVTVTVNPVHDKTIDSKFADATGKISIDMSWASSVAIEKVKLIKSTQNDDGTVTESIAAEMDVSSSNANFTCDLPIGLGQRYFFEFFKAEDEYAGYAGPEIYNIYAGQTSVTDNNHLYENIVFTEARNITDFTVSAPTSLNTLDYSFTVPKKFKEVSLSYAKTGESTYTEISTLTMDTEGVTPNAIYKSKLTNLDHNTEYTFAVQTTATDGRKSRISYTNGKTAIPAASVAIVGEETELNKLEPNQTYQLSLAYTPAAGFDDMTPTDLGGTWESLTNDVVSVSDTGLITVKVFGDATIKYTANNNNVSDTIAFKTQLSTPVLTLTADGNKLVASWNRIGMADNYVLYRTANGKTEAIATYTGTDIINTMTYEDKYLTSGTEYTYYVTASYQNNQKSSNSITKTFVVDPDITIVVGDAVENLEVIMSGMNQYQEFLCTDPIYLSTDIQADSYKWTYFTGKYIKNENGEKVEEVIILSTSANVTIPDDPDATAEADASKRSIMLEVTKNGTPYSGTLNFYFVDVKASGVSLSESTVSTNALGQAKVSATVSPANASIKEVRYYSSDESIATVDPVTGEVQALTKGNVNIYAYPIGNKALAEYVSIDTSPFVTEINFTKKSKYAFFAAKKAGATVDNAPTVEFTAQTNGTGYQNVSFSSSDKSIANITANGVLTPVSAGTTTITVQSSDNPSITTSMEVQIIEVAIYEGSTNLTSSTRVFYRTVDTNKSFTVTAKLRYNSTDSFESSGLPAGYSVSWPAKEIGDWKRNIKLSASNSFSATGSYYGSSYSHSGEFEVHIKDSNNNNVISVPLSVMTSNEKWDE